LATPAGLGARWASLFFLLFDVSKRMRVTSLPPSFTGVVKFTADWCGPCRRIQRDLIEACKAHSVELLEVDVDADSTLPASFEVCAMPTILFVSCGVEVKDLRVVGANMQEIIANLGLFSSANVNQLNQIDLPVNDAASVQWLPPTSRPKE